MKWFGRSKKKETVDDETEHLTKLKKDGETTSEKTTANPSTQKLGFVATVSPDGTPNLSPKGTIIAWDENTLTFADIRSPQTIRNLKNNPSIEINVIDPFSRKGFRFKGDAEIISNGEKYDKIFSHYQKSGVKSSIKSIVLVDVKEVNEVLSPLYDLGFTEDEIKTRWKKYYLSF